MTEVRSPLPWVKLHTRLVNHLQLRDVPIAERGVFLYLLMLGGISTGRGTILGSDAEIAKLIGAARSVVTRAIDRLSMKPFEMLRRVDCGVEIVNWSHFQTPLSSDPEYHAWRRAVKRPSAVRQWAANERQEESRPDEEGEENRQGAEESRTEAEREARREGERGRGLAADLETDLAPSGLRPRFPDPPDPIPGAHSGVRSDAVVVEYQVPRQRSGR